MKARNKTIACLRGEVGKLTAEKQVMDEKLAQLRPLRQHVGELDRLWKELEEKDSRLEKLSSIQRELEKKDSKLKLAQERLKKANSALQRARVEEEAACKLAKNCSLIWMKNFPTREELASG